MLCNRRPEGRRASNHLTTEQPQGDERRGCFHRLPGPNPAKMNDATGASAAPPGVQSNKFCRKAMAAAWDHRDTLKKFAIKRARLIVYERRIRLGTQSSPILDLTTFRLRHSRRERIVEMGFKKITRRTGERRRCALRKLPCSRKGVKLHPVQYFFNIS